MTRDEKIRQALGYAHMTVSRRKEAVTAAEVAVKELETALDSAEEAAKP